jgi:hypothetical protein
MIGTVKKKEEPCPGVDFTQMLPPPTIPPTRVFFCSPIRDMLTPLAFTGFFSVRATSPEMVSPGAKLVLGITILTGVD